MIKYGLDIRVQTTIRDDDGWRPVMLNDVARRSFKTPEELFRFEDALKRSNTQLTTRVVELVDDDPTYSL